MKTYLLIFVIVYFKAIHLMGQDQVLIVIDIGPRFPGCEQSFSSKYELENCAQMKMREYIYDHLEYPQKAKRLGIEGQVIVQFIVNRNGMIEQIELIRGIGGGCDQAAIDVVEKMNNLESPWIPGFQRGVPVNVKYTLPIIFKFEEK